MIYISDLDGTLLNSDGKLSQYTVQIIKQLRNDGIKFTIASARSIVTAAEFIKILELDIPVILRNGAFVYSPADNKMLIQKLLTKKQIQPIIDFFIAEGLNPIVHHTDGAKLCVDYMKIGNYGEQQYIESRLRAGDRRFRKVTEYKYNSSSEFISMCVINENDKQNAVFDKVEKLFPEGYIIHKYVDTYSNHTWIEVNHPEATKKNAADYVLDYIGESEYTAFGDNINDLSLLNSAVAAYVPQNSYLEKAGFNYEATLPIDRDGVALKLLEIAL